jgi:hypothetical protein
LLAADEADSVHSEAELAARRLPSRWCWRLSPSSGERAGELIHIVFGMTLGRDPIACPSLGLAYAPAV